MGQVKCHSLTQETWCLYSDYIRIALGLLNLKNQYIYFNGNIVDLWYNVNFCYTVYIYIYVYILLDLLDFLKTMFAFLCDAFCLCLIFIMWPVSYLVKSQTALVGNGLTNQHQKEAFTPRTRMLNGVLWMWHSLKPVWQLSVKHTYDWILPSWCALYTKGILERL